MKRTRALPITAGLALLLAACTPTPAPALEYEGTSTTEGVTHDLRVSLNHGNGIIRGTYTVGVATGTLSGTIDDTTVLAILTPSSTCTYAFEGTLTPAAFSGTFTPEECPGGMGGTWDLTAR